MFYRREQAECEAQNTAALNQAKELWTDNLPSFDDYVKIKEEGGEEWDRMKQLKKDAEGGVDNSQDVDYNWGNKKADATVKDKADEGAVDSKIYTPVEFTGTVKVNGKVRDVSRRVYQRKGIDFNYYDEDNKSTNLQRMKIGKPPIGDDGKPIQLHHLTQREKGSMVEILEVTHQEYFSQLHGLAGKGESFRNNPLLEKQYNNFRSKYWKWRYEQLTK